MWEGGEGEGGGGREFLILQTPKECSLLPVWEGGGGGREFLILQTPKQCGREGGGEGERRLATLGVYMHVVKSAHISHLEASCFNPLTPVVSKSY